MPWQSEVIKIGEKNFAAKRADARKEELESPRQSIYLTQRDLDVKNFYLRSASACLTYVVVNDSRDSRERLERTRDKTRREQGNQSPLHKCIRREFCNCQYSIDRDICSRSPRFARVAFIRAYVKAASLDR